MPSTVSRRDFLKIATGSIVTLPGVAAATLVTVPHQALAAEQEPTTDDILYTNEVELIPLTLSEVAFVVCDVSIGEPQKNRVAGAHVKVISTATGQFVEGDTAEDGSIMFDIKELAICGKDESRDNLKKYSFIGCIEITCEGYRDFLTGQFYVEGLQTHVIPTRRLEPSWPYPARVSFDGWDVLYVDNTPALSKMNDDVHFLAVTIRNVSDDDEVILSLCEEKTKKVIHTADDLPEHGEFSGGFAYRFMQLGNEEEALVADTDYCLRLTQGDKTWEFPIRLKPKPPIVEQPEVVKPAKALKPVGDPKTGKASVKLNRLIPIGGGSSISNWIPSFGPVQVAIDPCGAITVAVTIGEMEYPWGTTKEWNLPPGEREATKSFKTDWGSVSTTTTDNDPNVEVKRNDGWKWFPQKTLAKQWEDQKKKIDKGLTNYQAAKAAKAINPQDRTISFSKVLKVNVKAQVFGIATWDIFDKDTGLISFTRNPGFTGTAGLALIGSLDYTYCNNFLAGPVPVLFQFGFKLSASFKATAGLVVRDTDEKRQEKIKAGLPVKSWSEIMGDFDYWGWDFTNTGFSLTFAFSPWISLGVGVKGVASVSVRGSINMTFYIGASFPASKLGPDRENPHMIWSIAAGLDLVFELFFFTYNLSVVDLSNNKFYDSWNDPQWQPDKWELGKFKLWEKKREEEKTGVAAQSMDDEPLLNETLMRALDEDGDVDIWGEVTDAFDDARMDEMLQNMTPITDDMMMETVEASLVSGLNAQSEEDEAPRQVVTVSYVEDIAVTDDGFAIPAIVYAFETAQEYEERLATVALAAQGQEQVEESGPSAEQAERQPEGQAAEQPEGQPEGEAAEQPEGQAAEQPEGQAVEQPEGQPEQENELEAQADEEYLSPFSYECPAYERHWDSPIGDLLAMGDEHPVVGLGDEGGVVLSDAYDSRLNPADRPVFGSQRMQVLPLGLGSVLSLRIGVVDVNGQPRTRVIVTKIAGEHNVGLTSVLDFKILKPQIKGLDWNRVEEEIEGYKREDLYDYEFFAATVRRYGSLTYLHVAVLSGRRDLASGGSNAEKLAQSATDLVLTWVYVNISPLVYNADSVLSSGRAPMTVMRNFSWPGSMIFGDDKKYHSISNLQLTHDFVTNSDPYVTTYLETALITFLDRSADNAADVLSHRDGVADIRLGMLFVARYDAGHYQTVRNYALAYPPAAIEQLIGRITDGSTHELRFWGRAGDHYTFMLRGATESSYYVLQIEPGSAAVARKSDDAIVAKIKNIRLVGKEDGTLRLHHWRYEDGQERYLGTKARLSTQAEGEEDDGGVDRELCLVTINDPDGTSPSLSFQGIGPTDFSLSSFGAYGDFIYWPGTKDGYAEVEPTEGEDAGDAELVDKDPVERSWLMGSRFRNGKFSEPFYLADLKHEIDHVVSISESGDALDVVSCGLISRTQGRADIFRTRIPYVRCITAIGAFVESPYVVHGRDANFFLTLRNDGNTFIGGCVVEMWYEGVPVGRCELAFTKDTLQESTYNPAVEGSDTLEDAEPDFVLPPGKTSMYRATFKIPDDWVGGVNEHGERIKKYVKFRACEPTTKVSTSGVMAAQAEDFVEEGVEYSVPEPLVPMETVPVELYEYDDMSHSDAPMTLLRDGGSGDKPAKTVEPLPRTGDGRGLALGSTLAAAAGAAMLAYGRRRAANEARADNE